LTVVVTAARLQGARIAIETVLPHRLALPGSVMTNSDIATIKATLHSRKHIWINVDYLESGEAAHQEFFLMWRDDRYILGLDRYLAKYEDAVDLYSLHLRMSFGELTAAVDYAVQHLGIQKSDLLRGRNVTRDLRPGGP
jgi:hypothetical protein